MRNIFTIIVLALISTANAQVIIGDAVGTATTKTSVLLEFALANKGIIVPYVRTLPTVAPIRVEGTIVLDAENPLKARMKYYNGNSIPGTNGWVDLSGQNGDVTTALSKQPPLSVSEDGAKSIIGARSSNADGVLILESATKAMVLPTVSDVNNIPSPSPGMMVYVNKEGSKRFAVYNGSMWSFWKP